ncbi:hypothetical protein GCM10023311_20790 [Flaviramulus aquimarinus]|uniref:SusE outer membrane protein domain-containing protein n=1 Tax=Flaviramulus aquimarinus TaxID=1170456 RepID=A0ABP9FEB0_9FLAO
MKSIFKMMLTIVLATMSLNSCTDSDTLYIASAPENGSFEITSSTTSILLNEINAETETAITFNWEIPSYGVDTPATYTLEMDLKEGNFSSPRTFTVSSNEKSFTHADLNFYALDFGLASNIEGDIKLRLKTSLKYNALESYSNAITITVTPYDTLTLLYDMPVELYLQGDAVPSNWGTPLPDSQKMTQIDNHRFGLITELVGGKNYAAITTPTTWSDPAYVAIDEQQPAAEGDFRPAGSATVPQWGGSPMSSPVTTGIYKVILDFTSGKYTATPEPSILIPPADLYIIGDATPLGWAANVDATQQFGKINEHTFEITIPLTAGGAFAFITATSYSDPAYKAKTTSQDASGGDFIASGSATTPAWGGNDIVAPTTGTYTIKVDFKSGTYILQP